MKRILLLFSALMLSCIALWAHDVVIAGIYYNLDKTNKTAEVTYRGDDPFSYEYSGSVRSPFDFKDMLDESGLVTFAQGHNQAFGTSFPICFKYSIAPVASFAKSAEFDVIKLPFDSPVPLSS